MDASDDLVIGQATHFDWPTLEPYARSLVRSGFSGHKILFVKGITPEAREHLLALKFELLEIVGPPMTKDFFQGAGRLRQTFYELNRDRKFRYVIYTDTRDVVFQRNPSIDAHKYLEEFGEYHHTHSKLIAASEFIPHTNEAWNASNIKNCYPEVEGWIADKPIYCSGVIAGRPDAVADLCLNVYFVARHLAAQVHGIDQAAYNIVMHQQAYKDITYVPDMDDAWCCNSQVMASPTLIETYRPWLQDEEPEFRNGLVFPKGSQTPFCIVHQYDRNPEWTQAIRQRYCRDERL